MSEPLPRVFITRRIPSVGIDRLCESCDVQVWPMPAPIPRATLGIVGFGRIGQAVARRARGFDMRVLCTTRGSTPDPDLAEPVSFETLLEQSDFVSLHVPLTPETQGLMNTAAFARMKQGAV